MGLTNFPNGITSFGVPVLSGIAGIPFTGKRIFCDPANGLDGRTGGSPARAVKTLPRALELATAGKNDVIVLIGDGGTTATARLEETLVWSKNATHLVGVAAPSMVAQRARISTATGATTNVNPLVQVTAHGCAFINFSLFQGVGQASTDEQLWSEEGQRNYYGNVAFGGMGSANGAGRAGSYTMRLYGGSENLFERCYFGVDTRDRTAANANVRLRKNASDVASTRNMWIDCVFAMRATQTTPLFVDANEVGCIDRFAWFKNCLFTNFGTSAAAAVVAHNASQGGYVIMDNCTAVGASDWTASDTSTVKIAGPVPNGDTSGMAVDSDAT